MRAGVKMLNFRMGFKLSYQLKIDCYKLLHVSLMGTMKQKPMVNTQMIKRKKCKHTTEESHQTTKEERKRKRKEQEELQKQPENN